MKTRKNIPRSKYTKNGRLRQGKAIGTMRGKWLRSQIWLPVRNALRNHLQRAPTGTRKRLASHLGLHQSQVHRFECSKCEHDQEPSFSTGLALLLYLERKITFKVATFRVATLQPKPKRKKERKHANEVT